MWALLGHLQGEANLLHFAGFLWSELRTITLKKFRGDTADITFVLCIKGGYLIRGAVITSHDRMVFKD